MNRLVSLRSRPGGLLPIQSSLLLLRPFQRTLPGHRFLSTTPEDSESSSSSSSSSSSVDGVGSGQGADISELEHSLFSAAPSPNAPDRAPSRSSHPRQTTTVRRSGSPGRSPPPPPPRRRHAPPVPQNQYSPEVERHPAGSRRGATPAFGGPPQTGQAFARGFERMRPRRRPSPLQSFHERRDFALERQGIDVTLSPEQVTEQRRLIDLATSVEDLVALFRMSSRERFVYPSTLYVHLWDRLIEFSQTQPDFGAKLALMPDMVSMETASYSILSDPECTPDILRRLAHLWSFLPYVCRGWIYLQRQAYLMRDLLKPQELSVIVCASQKIRPSTEFMGFMKPKIYEHLPTINLTSFLLILEALSYSQTTMYEPVLAHAVFDRAFHLVSKTSRFDAAVLELVARVSDIRRDLLAAGCHVELFLTSVCEMPELFTFADGRPLAHLERLSQLLLRFKDFNFRHVGFLEALGMQLHGNAELLKEQPGTILNAIDGYSTLDPFQSQKLLTTFSETLLENLEGMDAVQARKLAAACWNTNFSDLDFLRAVTVHARKLGGFPDVPSFRQPIF